MKLLFIVIGCLFMCGACYNLALYRKPGMYPPKFAVKKRAAALAGCGVFLIAGGWLLIAAG